MMSDRFIRQPFMGHKALFDCGNLLLSDDDSRLPQGLLQALLKRHTTGDWGDIPCDLCQTNQYALEFGCSLLSCFFHPGKGIRLVVIRTTADRTLTTIQVHL
ncbi:hypothetical protein ACU6ZM_22565 [Klebsiella aerogenes]